MESTFLLVEIFFCLMETILCLQWSVCSSWIPFSFYWTRLPFQWRKMYFAHYFGIKTLENILANIYLLKVNNGKTRKRYEICSRLIIKTLEWRQWRYSGIFIDNFKHTSHLFLVFLMLSWKRYFFAGFWNFYMTNQIKKN